MSKWEIGRQGGEYKKLKIWEKMIGSFGTDCWIIDFNPFYHLQRHTDEVEGSSHYRLNIVFSGKGKFEIDKTIFNLFDRVIFFRPDLHIHSMRNSRTHRKVLSIGFTFKKTPKKTFAELRRELS